MGHAFADIELSNPKKPGLKSIRVRALADTGALMLCIPEHIALQLKLETESMREVSVADGRSMNVPYVGPIRINFEKRICFVGALVLGDEVLLGAVPMEDMDLIISPGRREVTVDPASPNIPHARVKSLLKQVLFLILFLLPGISGYSQSAAESPLKLTIAADKESYSVGEEIKINCTIENVSEAPVGFYVRDSGDLKISVSNLFNTPYPYYEETLQREMPSIYPDQYILLNPHEKWQRNQSLQFKNGKLLTYKGSKEDPQSKLDHDGFYLHCPGGCVGYDDILLPSLPVGKIKVSAEYSTSIPNPQNFTRKDCEKAKISVDVFSEDSKSNTISRSVINANKNFNFDDPFLEDTFNLAIYCQHNSALSKKAWIGTLSSHSIEINLNTK